MPYDQARRSRALLLIHLSNVLFALTALAVGRLSPTFDGYFTSFSRFAVGTVLGFTQLALTGKPFKIHRFKPWLGRGVFGSLSMTLYYVSIELGSAGRASLFNNSFPIFVALISIFVLRERVRPVTVAGIFIAFLGVALVLWDGRAASLLGDVLGVASGVIGGVSYHFNKRASRTEDSIVIYLSVCLVGLAFNAFSLPQAAKLSPGLLVFVLLAGSGAYFAQVAITSGLRDIETTAGSVHTFAKIPLTILGSFLVFGDPVSLRFLLGTVLLIAGILLDKILPEGRRPAVD